MHKFIISDTSCLIALDRINRLGVLQKLFSTIFTTKEVQEEFGSPLPSWIIVREVTISSNKKKLENILDKGEASAIALAMETENSILIIDEKKGRRVAKELQLEIIGTLRILLLAKQNKHIPSVKEAIKDLEQNNFRFAKPIMDSILKEAGEK